MTRSAMMLFFGWFLTLGSVFSSNLPTTSNVGLNRGYIPLGFDDNDRIQIAIEGTLPNTCYRVGPHAMRVDTNTKKITLQQQAYVYPGVCLQVQTPFTQFVDVGLLPAGTYSITDYESKNSLGNLVVTRSANDGPDDFLYAPITDAYLISNPESKSNRLVLSGTFADRCSQIDEVKVIYQDRVLVVQPIMKRTDSRCEPLKTRFLKTVDLDTEIHGLYLLHVRSLNGQAINRMVDVF